MTSDEVAMKAVFEGFLIAAGNDIFFTLINQEGVWKIWYGSYVSVP